MKLTSKYIWLIIIAFMLPLLNFAQNNNFNWVTQIGGAQPQYAHILAVDNDNNTYTLGQYSGALGINIDSVNVPLTGFGNSDLFILKQDPNGQVLWVKGFGGKGSETPYGIALDKWGGVYLTGSFADTVDFNPSATQSYPLVSVGQTSGFVLKLDTAGSFQWALKTSSDSFNSASAVTSIDVDSVGNLYTTGFFSAIASFPNIGANATLTTNGGTDVFVYKLDTAGSFKWAKSFGAAQYDYGYTVKVDKSGNVYTVGMVVGEADFDPGAGTFMMKGGGGQYGGGGLFISKLDASGNFVWAKNLGDNTLNQGVFANYFHHLNVDINNNLIVSGWFIGTVDMDPSPTDSFMLTANGSYDGFVAKYDTAGDFQWARKIGGTGADYGRAVTTDRIGNIYVGGIFRQSIVVDSATNNILTPATTSANDVYIVKFTTSGDLIWSTKFGGNANEYITSLATDHKNNVYSTGNFLSNILGNIANFHNGQDSVKRISNGYDGFVHKMICIDTSFTELIEVACNEFVFGNDILTQSGVYQYQFWSQGGCDSSVSINLTVNYIDKPFITVNNFTLGVTSPYAQYQWLKNGVVIANATNATYDVDENAAYTVVVTTTEGCVDTSDAYQVSNVTSVWEHELSQQVTVYPNPVTDKLYIKSPVNVSYYVSNVAGIIVVPVSSYQDGVAFEQLGDGVYFIHILDKEGRLIKVEKVVKK